MPTDLPLGIYFERARRRYRVRLHRYNKVVHCSYHKSLENAKKALEIATAFRIELSEPAKHRATAPTVQNLLGSLARR